MTLDEPLLTVASRYTRSIHLTRDYARITDGLAGYQVTPLVATTIARIVAGLAPTATARAFSLVGMYGAGKSAFGVFLAHFLASDPEARHLLLRAHARNTLAEQVPLGAPVLLPVLVSGSHTALGQTLMHALRETLVTYAPSAYADLQSDLDAALEGSVLDSAHIVALYEHAIQAVQAVTAYEGIVLIVDELGQFLDYAAYQQSERDLFVLQVLAEMAARSDTVPFLIVTILHQAFEQYAGTAGPMQRQEWAKVQGRYIDLPFQEPASEMLRMIGRALCPEPQQRNHPERQQWATALAPLSDALGLRPPEIGTDEWVSLLAETYPLHPTVLVALPMLFRQLAQNERSLFAFLVTHEPWSLRDVVEQRSTDVLPIYRLTHLYAYVEAVLGPSLFGRAQGRRWAELAEARQYLHANEGL